MFKKLLLICLLTVSVKADSVLSLVSSNQFKYATNWLASLSSSNGAVKIASTTGTSDDTASIQATAATLQSGQTLVIPNGLIVPTSNNAAITFTGLSNITIVGSITNNTFTMTSTNWFPISSLVSTGTLVLATVPSNIGFTGIKEIGVYNDGPRDYNGIVTVTSNSPTTFSYNTLGGTPSGPGSGLMQWTYEDFNRVAFRFKQCKNVKVNISYNAPYIHRSVRYRLGLKVLEFIDDTGAGPNDKADINLVGGGFANGLSVGYFKTPYIGQLINATANISATNAGYPLSSWGGMKNSTYTFNVGDVHRGGYAAFADGLTVNGVVTNFDRSGFVIDSHPISGTNHYGARKSSITVTDGGTTDDSSDTTGSNGRFLVGFNGEPDGGTPVIDDLVLNPILKVTDTVGKNIVAARVYHQGTNIAINKLRFTGLVDRSAVTSTNGFYASYECFFRMPPLAPVNNVTFRDWVIFNSSVTTNNLLFSRDIQVTNNVGLWLYDNAISTSFQNVIIGGTVVNRDNNAILVADGSAGAPSLSWTLDPTTGLYHNTSGIIRVANSGVLAASFAGTTFFPATTASYDLGSQPQKFRDIFFGGVNKDQTTLSWSGTTTLNFADQQKDMRVITLGGDTTFATSNRQAGKDLTIRIIGAATNCNTTYPSWHFTSATPTSLVANKNALLRLTTWGTNDTDVVAVYTVEP